VKQQSTRLTCNNSSRQPTDIQYNNPVTSQQHTACTVIISIIIIIIIIIIESYTEYNEKKLKIQKYKKKCIV